MKKLILIAFIAAVTLSAYSAPKNVDYVVTEEGVSYFLSVRHGINNTLICKLEDGSRIKLSLNDVNSYRKSGEVFEKRQIFKNGEPCSDCDFLQVMKVKHGISLYMCQQCVRGEYVNKFFVYKDDNYILEVNEDNYLQMLSFFDL